RNRRTKRRRWRRKLRRLRTLRRNEDRRTATRISGFGTSKGRGNSNRIITDIGVKTFASQGRSTFFPRGKTGSRGTLSALDVDFRPRGEIANLHSRISGGHRKRRRRL